LEESDLRSKLFQQWSTLRSKEKMKFDSEKKRFELTDSTDSNQRKLISIWPISWFQKLIYVQLTSECDRLKRVMRSKEKLKQHQVIFKI